MTRLRYLLLPLVLLFAGCVNLAEPVSMLDENLGRIIANQEKIARVLPVDSPVRQLVEENYWRSAELVRPISAELKRYAGPAAVSDKVPDSRDDTKRYLAHTKAVETLGAEIDLAKSLPFTDPPSALKSLETTALEHSPWGIVASAGLWYMRRKRREVLKLRQQRASYNAAMNRAKQDPGAKAAIVAATEGDPVLQEAYRESQINAAQNRQHLASQVMDLVG